MTNPNTVTVPIKLLPCPFCGITPQIGRHRDERCFVECANNECVIPVTTRLRGTPATAAGDWNRRAGERELRLPASYIASTMTSGNDGEAKVSFHFSSVKDAERWFEAITDTAAPKQQAADKETLVAFERVFWKAVELSGSRDFDHDVCKEVRDFRSLLAALPDKKEVDRGRESASVSSA